MSDYKNRRFLPQNQKTKILGFMKDNGNKINGDRAAEVLGISKKSGPVYLSRLASEGVIHHSGGGVYTLAIDVENASGTDYAKSVLQDRLVEATSEVEVLRSKYEASLHRMESLQRAIANLD